MASRCCYIHEVSPGYHLGMNWWIDFKSFIIWKIKLLLTWSKYVAKLLGHFYVSTHSFWYREMERWWKFIRVSQCSTFDRVSLQLCWEAHYIPATIFSACSLHSIYNGWQKVCMWCVIKAKTNLSKICVKHNQDHPPILLPSSS